MNLTVTRNNIHITKAMKDHLIRKIKKVIKGLKNHVDVHVVVAAEKHRHFAKINVKAKGFSLKSKDDTYNLYTSMGHALNKMRKQLSKQKNRVVSLKRKNRKVEQKQLDMI